jgi:hypothetical protein
MLPRIFREAGIRHIEKRLEKMATFKWLDPVFAPEQVELFKRAQADLASEMDPEYLAQLQALYQQYMQPEAGEITPQTAGIAEENAPKIVNTPQ